MCIQDRGIVKAFFAELFSRPGQSKGVLDKHGPNLLVGLLTFTFFGMYVLLDGFGQHLTS